MHHISAVPSFQQSFEFTQFSISMTQGSWCYNAMDWWHRNSDLHAESWSSWNYAEVHLSWVKLMDDTSWQSWHRRVDAEL